jgi:hypothetical protein
MIVENGASTALGKIWGQLIVGSKEVFWQYASLPYGGDEAGISCPAGEDVQVQVVCYAGAGALPKIHTEIIPFGMIAISQCRLQAAGQLHHFGERGGCGLFEAGDVGVRDHHRVAGGVRKEIEKDKIRAAAIQKQVLPIAGGIGRALFTENATPRRDGLADVAKPPRTPKVVHNRDACDVAGFDPPAGGP